MDNNTAQDNNPYPTLAPPPPPPADALRHVSGSLPKEYSQGPFAHEISSDSEELPRRRPVHGLQSPATTLNYPRTLLPTHAAHQPRY